MRFKLPSGAIVGIDHPFELDLPTHYPPRGHYVPKELPEGEERGEGEPELEFVEVMAETTVMEPHQFPGGVRSLSIEEREKYGIAEVIEQGRPNERFYFVSEDPDTPGSYIATPKAIDGIKEMLTNEVNARAAGMLAPTDWQVTRSVEGKPIDAKVSKFRAAVRANANAVEKKINAAKKLDTLTALNLDEGWPEQPV